MPEQPFSLELLVALATLDPREREAIVDSHVIGRPSVRLAEVWGVSEARVNYVRRRGERKLRAVLGHA